MESTLLTTNHTIAGVSNVTTTLGTLATALATAPPVTTSQFVAVPADKFLADHQRPPAMIADGLFEEGATIMLSGATGSGKTAILMEFAIAAATGTPLAGHFPVARRKVLFVAAEQGKNQYAKQLRKLLFGRGLTSIPIEIIHDPSIDLRFPSARQSLTRLVVDGGYEVVIADTLKALSTADENSNTEMDPVMSWFVSLATDKRTVVFVHHTGKPGLDALGHKRRPGKHDSRGASCIAARCDMEWRVELEGTNMTLTCVKSRGEVLPGTVRSLVMDWDSACIAFSMGRTADLRGAILEALGKAGDAGLRRNEIVSAVAAHLGQAQDAAFQQRVKRTLKDIRPLLAPQRQGQPYRLKEGVKGSGL